MLSSLRSRGRRLAQVFRTFPVPDLGHILQMLATVVGMFISRGGIWFGKPVRDENSSRNVAGTRSTGIEED